MYDMLHTACISIMLALMLPHQRCDYTQIAVSFVLRVLPLSPLYTACDAYAAAGAGVLMVAYRY
jgi:hypothetical protein